MASLKTEKYKFIVMEKLLKGFAKDSKYFSTVKIALLGYGKMGKEIEQLALSNGDEIVLRADKSHAVSLEDLKQADVAIEFTQPDAAVKNIRVCFEANVPVVVGTTGWYEELKMVKIECEAKHQALLYASNFSIGVNIFFELNKRLAQLMSKQTVYTVAIDEIHHTQKIDMPSGTAISLANDMLSELPFKNQWQLDEQKNYPQEKLLIHSHRKEDVAGTHIITYQSFADTIEIKHTAHNRIGFAQGALLAAGWLKGKQGVFTMKDVLFKQ